MKPLPAYYLGRLLNCFEMRVPDTVILGGSYSTAENCKVEYCGKDLWLSDFDLFCISKEPYSLDETHRIFRKAWKLSREMPQSNPYFHIGMKLRGELDLVAEELNSLYYHELIDHGVVLRGKPLRAYFESNEGPFFHRWGKGMLYEKLYDWALARLWCYILFFPIRVLKTDLCPIEKIWYSYFASRGAMDWITFELLENGCWADSYKKRFEIWQSAFAVDRKTTELMSRCLEIRLGLSTDLTLKVVPPVLTYSLMRIRHYESLSPTHTLPAESAFVMTMLEILAQGLQGKDCLARLRDAEGLLGQLTGEVNSVASNSGWDRWNELRSVYANYRFSNFPKDNLDHRVYTEHFLRIGCNHQ